MSSPIVYLTLFLTDGTRVECYRDNGSGLVLNIGDKYPRLTLIMTESVSQALMKSIDEAIKSPKPPSNEREDIHA